MKLKGDREKADGEVVGGISWLKHGVLFFSFMMKGSGAWTDRAPLSLMVL